jgi:hypothetical protein
VGCFGGGCGYFDCGCDVHADERFWVLDDIGAQPDIVCNTLDS